MPYTIDYDSEKEYFKVKIEGNFGETEANDYAKEIFAITKKYQCKKLLNDIRNANLNFSTLAINNLPWVLRSAGMDRLMKRALVVPKNDEDSKFFEIVSLNRSQYVRIFEDPDEALDWLITDQDDSAAEGEEE